MTKRNRVITRLSMVLLAYVIAGPVWFRTTIHDDGSVTEYKRIGIFKWMERKRYSWPQNSGIVKHGAFIRTPGVVASMVCFAALLGLAWLLEKKWKGQQIDGEGLGTAGAAPSPSS